MVIIRMEMIHDNNQLTLPLALCIFLPLLRTLGVSHACVDQLFKSPVGDPFSFGDSLQPRMAGRRAGRLVGRMGGG